LTLANDVSFDLEHLWKCSRARRTFDARHDSFGIALAVGGDFKFVQATCAIQVEGPCYAVAATHRRHVFVMKELKFTCPSCGQHIQCDWRHAGENVPCPGCAVLIRVPSDGDLADADTPSDTPAPSPPPRGDNPFAPVADDAEKVSYASAKAGDGSEPKKSPAPLPGATVAPPVTTNPAPSAAPAAHTSELHCVCPVCQSELRISVKPEPALRGKPHPAGAPLPGVEPLPLDERERKIAAARERAFHPASEKPRLDRILGEPAVGPFSPSD
jgi:hypothetical protein